MTNRGSNMAIQQLTLPGEIVKKDNELIRSRINIASVEGSRLLANLIACVRHYDTQFKDTYKVAVKDFITDSSGRGYTQIRAVCRELAKATAEIEEPDANSSHPTFRIYTFFSSITYKKGVVQARFNQEMQPLLLDLQRCFTQYNLMEYLLLPSLYSQRLFEILKSWSGRPEVLLELEELHRLLDTPPSLRTDFRNFRLRVLEKAHADIHEFTSLKYEWEAIKKGRRVDSIRFVFTAPRIEQVDTKKEKIEQSKTSKQNNKLFLDCADCFQKKGNPKNCFEADNSKKCQLCQALNF